MNIRKRKLPPGWYPGSRKEIERQFTEWDGEYDIAGDYRAAVVPHAGWYFSGKLAYAGIKALQGACDTVVIIGGHMHAGSGIVGYSGGGVETPLGSLMINSELFQEVGRSIKVREDTAADNTIEIQLPMVKYFFPDTQILAYRLPPDSNALEFTRVLHEICRSENLKIRLIGSTDLTHYGPAYQFTPKGTGKDALKWVVQENDKRIIDAMTALDADSILEYGAGQNAACSSGAAAAAAEFAKLKGITAGHVIDYYTSASINPGSSFVGYAGIVF